MTDAPAPAPGPAPGPAPVTGRVARTVAWVTAHPPPGSGQLLSGRLWRSPLRGPWLTSVFGAVLLVGMPVLIVTGLASFLAYQPQFAGNAQPADVGWLHLPYVDWPASPGWLYRVTQGLHVVGGIVLVPVVLAKLWSVIPKLFAWPPAVSVLQLLERLSLVMLVGGILFEMVTGIMDVQYDYAFGFDFYTAHYWGAWVFIAGFVAHTVLKVPLMVRALRTRSLALELRTPRDRTAPEVESGDSELHGLVPVTPGPATTSRRGALAMVGGGSLLLFVVTAGASLSDRLRGTAVFSARGRTGGSGPTGFPVNKTASGAGITAAAAGTDWRLALDGAPGSTPVSLSRAELLGMPQHTARVPIACVEGWSTVQTWTGVRLRDLAALVGVTDAGGAVVTSLEKGSPYSRVTLNGGQVRAGDAVLALRVNGVDLSPDHGYPARVVVPAIPGVHATKWVAGIAFGATT